MTMKRAVANLERALGGDEGGRHRPCDQAPSTHREWQEWARRGPEVCPICGRAPYVLTLTLGRERGEE